MQSLISSLKKKKSLITIIDVHLQIKVIFVIPTALLLDRNVIRSFHHSSNAKIIISLLSRLLCNNMYSGIGAPLVRQIHCECVCLSGTVKPDWSPPPTHQRMTESYPEAQPASDSLIIMRTQLSDTACLLQRVRRQTETSLDFYRHKRVFLLRKKKVFTG